MNNNGVVEDRILEAYSKSSPILDLEGLDITGIPDDLSKLSTLEILNLSNNKIKDYKILLKLKNLRIVDLRNNNISNIKEDILSLNLPIKWEFDYQSIGIYFGGNPVENLPVEIIHKGNSAIRLYYSTLEKSGSVEIINDAKIVLVGDGNVGKTSITRRMVYDHFLDGQFSTHGINIHELLMSRRGQSLRLKIWDFGGQEIMHSTHQLFFTKRTLYLLVLDSRREHKGRDISYWINTLISTVGQVPIIIVINKTDINPYFDVDRELLTSKYPNILSILKTSCRTGEGISELKDYVTKAVLNFEYFNSIIPRSWWEIRACLEKIQWEFDYIPIDEYFMICEDYGVSDNHEKALISDYLHDLGVLIHFKNLQLYNTQILNPFWITEAIYKVINAKVGLVKRGILDLKTVTSILSNSSYRYDEQNSSLIIRIMIEFELAIEIEENVFMLLDQLPINRPSIKLSSSDSIIFLFKFGFLPKGLFPRIIVKLYEIIVDDLVWRNGVFVRYKDSEAILEIDYTSSQIKIQSEGKDKKELLFVLREAIKKANLWYTNLEVTELVNVSKLGINVNYNDLKIYREENLSEIFIPSLRKNINIDTLLNSIEPSKQNEINPIQIFISYSHKDVEYKEALISHLYPFIRLREILLWQDGKITPGQNWRNEIMNNLEDSEIILCLISSDFIRSEFCYSVELGHALNSHGLGRKIVIPIQVRDCIWKNLPIGEIQGTPSNPISSYNNIDEGWVEVVQSINKALESIRKIKYGTQQSIPVKHR